jgi:hypothetical protein
LILYLTPPIRILFLSNFIFILAPPPYLSALISRDEFKLLFLDELVEESRIVTEALSTFPSGLNIP